ncbi:hypothetical protein QE382_001997 [Sphingobacterium zeae]|uniref:DUF4372 domain-containing protein n=1 Tax=Sphingobacterium zeae TaxID=1776859 RepID=A0ABU0U705_9SPHI|nr:hypothetical protein [Sphingobacterium zeae]
MSMREFPFIALDRIKYLLNRKFAHCLDQFGLCRFTSMYHGQAERGIW